MTFPISVTTTSYPIQTASSNKNGLASTLSNTADRVFLTSQYAPYFAKYIAPEDMCDCESCVSAFFKDPVGVMASYGVELRRSQRTIQSKSSPNGPSTSSSSTSFIIEPEARPARDSYGRSLLQTMAKEQFIKSKEEEDDEQTKAFKSNLVETVVLGTRPTPAQEAARKREEERTAQLLDYTPGGLPPNATLGNPLLYLRPHTSIHPPQGKNGRRTCDNLRSDGSPYKSGTDYEYHFECKFPGCRLTGANEWNMRRHIRTVHLRFPVTKREMEDQRLDVTKVELEESKYIQTRCTAKKKLKSPEEIRRVEEEVTAKQGPKSKTVMKLKPQKENGKKKVEKKVKKRIKKVKKKIKEEN